MHLSKLEMNSSVNLEEAGVTSFDSKGYITNTVSSLPEGLNTRIIMMPFDIDNLDTIPDNLSEYKQAIKEMLDGVPEHVSYYDSSIGYLTIDSRLVVAGESQRNKGLHIDGMLDGCLAGAWGGSGGSHGSTGNGMLICSNADDMCSFHTGTFKGVPISRPFDGSKKLDGDCEHLRDQLTDSDINTHIQKANEVLWADGMLVHESLPTDKDIHRTLIRISLPNNSPWFSSYTENPLGVLPQGKILDDKRFN